jgi:hypothetical protein
VQVAIFDVGGVRIAFVKTGQRLRQPDREIRKVLKD